MESERESPVQRLRQVLESKLSGPRASAVLFDALGSMPSLPTTVEDVALFVHGPLRDALLRRVEADEAETIVESLDAAFGEQWGEEETTDRTQLDALVEQSRRDRDATTQFPILRAPVDVCVAASGVSFAHRLEAALGPRRVVARTVSSPTALGRLRDSPPTILLVDASDFPAIDQAELRAIARALPVTTACVLFGADLPFGKSFRRGLVDEPRGWVTLELREGLPPLLDLIRSRRST